MFDMTREEFEALDKFSGQRVHLTFIEGQQVVATLSNISIDIDGSQHLVYGDVEWASPLGDVSESGWYYSAGEELVSCVAIAKEANFSSSP